MNKIHFLIFSLLSISFLSCSQKDSIQDPYGLNELSNSVLIATGDAVDISALDARLQGSVNLEAVISTLFRVGFLYGDNRELTVDSKNNSYQTVQETENNCFSVSLGQLLAPNTVYYYRAVLELNERYYYGEIKEFKTRVATLDDFIGEWKYIYARILNEEEVAVVAYSCTPTLSVSKENIVFQYPRYWDTLNDGRSRYLFDRRTQESHTISFSISSDGTLKGSDEKYAVSILLTGKKTLKLNILALTGGPSLEIKCDKK